MESQHFILTFFNIRVNVREILLIIWIMECLLSQRLLGAVQRNATRGNPHSVLNAIDQFCRHTEWAMNVGDEKGADVVWRWRVSLHILFFFWIYFTHPPKIHSFLWCACVQQGVSWTLSCQRSTPPLCWSWEPTAATPRWGSLGCCLPTPSSSLWNSTPTLPPSLARSSPGLEWKIRFGSKQSCVSEWAEVVRMTWGFGEGGHSECLDRWWDKMIKMIGWIGLIW